jgi:hypothetical protein
MGPVILLVGHRYPIFLRAPILVQQWKTCNQIFSVEQDYYA